MVYIIPYAQKQGCTVTDNNSNVVVKYQHRFYSGPETCTYYKSLSGEQAYKRQVIVYCFWSLYEQRNIPHGYGFGHY